MIPLTHFEVWNLFLRWKELSKEKRFLPLEIKRSKRTLPSNVMECLFSRDEWLAVLVERK